MGWVGFGEPKQSRKNWLYDSSMMVIIYVLAIHMSCFIGIYGLAFNRETNSR